MGVHCANDEAVGRDGRVTGWANSAGASKDSHRQRSPRQRCQAHRYWTLPKRLGGLHGEKEWIESWWPGSKLNLIGFKLTWQSVTYEINHEPLVSYLEGWVKGKHQEPNAFGQVFCLWFNGEITTVARLSIYIYIQDAHDWASKVTVHWEYVLTHRCTAHLKWIPSPRLVQKF